MNESVKKTTNSPTRRLLTFFFAVVCSRPTCDCPSSEETQTPYTLVNAHARVGVYWILYIYRVDLCVYSIMYVCICARTKNVLRWKSDSRIEEREKVAEMRSRSPLTNVVVCGRHSRLTFSSSSKGSYFRLKSPPPLLYSMVRGEIYCLFHGCIFSPFLTKGMDHNLWT